jgi:uncharacterized membrane protein YesL
MHFFRIDGPLFRFLEKVANLIILNILLIICSIPIITIGPALTATYYVNLKMVRGEERGIIKDFFHSFRMNFKQALPIGIVFVLLAVLLTVDIYALTYLVTIPSDIAQFLIVVVSLIGLLVLIIGIYLFAILAQFDNKTSMLIKWCIIIAIRHLPITLISLVLVALPFMILYFLPGIFFQSILPIMLLLGFSGIGYLQSYFYVRVFAYYIPSEEKTEEEP